MVHGSFEPQFLDDLAIKTVALYSCFSFSNAENSGPPPRQARSPRRTRRRIFFLYWDRALIYLTSCGKSRKVACPCWNALTKGKENLLCDLSTIFRPSPSRQCSTGFWGQAVIRRRHNNKSVLKLFQFLKEHLDVALHFERRGAGVEAEAGTAGPVNEELLKVPPFNEGTVLSFIYYFYLFSFFFS